tara:strand:+ start:1187 stop:1987 length:801 start_codon:yes stop_codon:yes gene_type:complete
MPTDYANRISYLIVDTSQHQMAQHALNISQRLFPLTNRIVFSDIKEGWDATKFVQVPKITRIEEYNELLLAEAWKHIETDFVQVIQWDGHVINPKVFRPQFLEVDYIGAVWPHHKTRRVGNGGFSLRSKCLMKAVHSLLVDITDWKTEPEDDLICRTLGERLELEHDIKFAKGMLAQHYSMEWDFENSDLPFGFHGMAMLIATHKSDIPSLLDRLNPVTGWQLTTMAQFIASLKQSDISAFYAFLQRHNLFDEFSRNLDMKVTAIS